MTKTATKFGMLVAMVVLAACGQAPVTLQELQVQPPVTEVTENLRTGVSAIAVYSDGTRQDVTAQVEWSSMDATVATASGGLIQGGIGRIVKRIGEERLLGPLEGGQRLLVVARVDVDVLEARGELGQALGLSSPQMSEPAATADALPEIADAIAGKAELYVDGGISVSR